MADLVSFVLIVGLPLVLGGISGAFASKSVPVWYRNLKKPSWNPPDWLFGPVWTILYILMGVSSWLIYGHGIDSPAVRFGLVLYGVQLILNILWSAIFFGLTRINIAFAEIIVLWVLILATLVQFLEIDLIAGLFLIPYIAWVTIATALNMTIWTLNKQIV